MKKMIMAFLLLLTLVFLVGCSNQTTTKNDPATSGNTTDNETSEPLSQNSLLSSLSQAIKDIFD